VSKYRDGGYSDDLILAALCDEHKRLVVRGMGKTMSTRLTE
jgi:hypothetical protein